jgi:hypothetical protein
LSVAVLLVVAVIWVMQLGWRILITPHHVEFTSYGSTIRCPWPLFRTEGTPVESSRGDRVLIPINQDQVGSVEKIRAGRTVAAGMDAKSFQIRFYDGKRAALSGFYGVNLEELALLLLALSHTATSGKSAARSLTVEDVAQPFRPGAGWHAVDFTRVSIPNRCCGCGGVADLQMRRFKSYAAWHVLTLGHGIIRFVHLPACRRCWWWFTFARWAVLACCFCLSIASFIMALSPLPSARWFFVGSVAVLISAPVLAWECAIRAPAKVRRLSASKGSAEIWTRQPGFFDENDALDAHSDATARPSSRG